jgi:hypothetical protein
MLQIKCQGKRKENSIFNCSATGKDGRELRVEVAEIMVRNKILPNLSLSGPDPKLMKD